MANILLVGLPSDTAADFVRKLEPLRPSITSQPYPSRSMDVSHVDLVLACSDDCRCRSLLRQVHRQRPELPFVMVSSMADDSKWIEALEAGATDYCRTDIDPSHLRWIVENALPLRAMVSAA